VAGQRLRMPCRGRHERRSLVRVTRQTTATEVKEAKSDAEVVAEVCLGDVPMGVIEWPMPKHAMDLATWLGDLEGTSSSQEANFWRARIVSAMKQRLEKLAFGDDYGDSSRDGRDPGFRVYALHPESSTAKAPVSLAFISERPFPLAPLEALHLDQIVSCPTSSGAGAALLQGLASVAARTEKFLVLEPQSEGLEAYFARLGFEKSLELDPYLWFLSRAGSEEPDVELRFAFDGTEAQDRLLAAFKRPPLWVGSVQETFVVARQDVAANDVLSVRVAISQNAANNRATARRFHRNAPTDSYTVGATEVVDVSEAMGVMRGPDVLDLVDWGCVNGLGSNTSMPGDQFGGQAGQFQGGVGYAGLGRCAVTQKAYPLPGLPQNITGVELVIEELEMPTRLDPVYSASLVCKPSTMAEVIRVCRSFFENFRVRAGLHRTPPSWNLEVSQTDGLLLLSLETWPLPEDDIELGEDFD